MMAERADITITVGGTAIGMLRQAQLEIDLDLVGVAPEDVYGWNEYLPATRGWAASGGVFIPLFGADEAHRLLKLAMTTRATISCSIEINGETETGTAVVGSLSSSRSIGGALEGSIQLVGTGGLTAS